MGIKLRQNIKVNDQFFDDNQIEPTNSACGVAATKSIYDYYYPDEHITLLEMIRLTPLLRLVNGTWTRNQTGLTCEQVMALCFRLKLNAHLEVLNIDKLKTYLDNEQPIIVLEDDRDITLFDDGVMLRQDHSGGYHFVVAVDHGVNLKGKLVIYTVDSDRVDPKSNFGQDVPIPEVMLSKAMYDSDQRDVCVVIDGVLSVQVDRVASIASGCNFRIQPTLQSFVQFGLSGGSQVEVLKDATINADGHIWQRCRSNDGFIGWIAQEFISNAAPTSMPRKLPVGPAYVISSGDQLNVRMSPNITAQSIGKLKALTPVMVLVDDPIKVGNFTWYHIMSDALTGWVAGEYLDTGITPIVVPPLPQPKPTPSPIFDWKQHVGLHLMGSLDLIPNGYGLYKGMGYDGQDQVGHLQKLHQDNPNATIIHRDYTAHNQWVNPEKFIIDNGGIQNAVQTWITNQQHYLDALPFAYHESFNESGMSDVYLAFEAERVRQLHARGYKACVLNVAGGTVDTPDWQRAKTSGLLQVLSETGSIIGVHCYGQSIMPSSTSGSYWNKDGDWRGEMFPTLISRSPDGNYDAWLTLRILRYVEDVKKLSFPNIRFCATELGLDDCVQPGNGVYYPREGKQNGWKSCVLTWRRLGWLNGATPEVFYKKQLEWWSTIVSNYPQIIGGTVFTYGTDDATWNNFDTRSVL